MFKSEKAKERVLEDRKRRVYSPPSVVRAAPVGVVTMGFSQGVET